MPRRSAKRCSGPPCVRFVPVKGADQQAVLLLHRTRDLLIRQRSSLISAIRAHFAEFGVVVGQRMRNIDRLLGLLVAEGTALPELARRMLAVLVDQLRDVAARVGVLPGRSRCGWSVTDPYRADPMHVGSSTGPSGR